MVHVQMRFVIPGLIVCTLLKVQATIGVLVLPEFGAYQSAWMQLMVISLWRTRAMSATFELVI